MHKVLDSLIYLRLAITKTCVFSPNPSKFLLKMGNNNQNPYSKKINQTRAFRILSMEGLLSNILKQILMVKDNLNLLISKSNRNKV